MCNKDSIIVLICGIVLLWLIFLRTSIRLANIEDMYKTTIESFEELQKDVDILESSILELKTEADTLKGQVENLQMVVDTHANEIDILKNELALIQVKQEYAIVPGILTKTIGVAWFEGHKETYYNLPMDLVISNAKTNIDICAEAMPWIREDGAKMLGDYIMVAADYDVHPYGSIVMTSLGEGMVVDTGSFIFSNSTQIDIATNW